MLNNCLFSIDPKFCLLLAISFLVLPAQWVIGWIVASALHEFSHLLMLRIFKIRVLKIRLCGFGAAIAPDSMLPIRELLCALAGPVGGFTTALTLRIYPYIALCGMIQSIYNLLPIYPLDGGRALKCLITYLYDGLQAERIVKVVSSLTICVLLLAGVYISRRYHLGLIPILLPALPVIFTTFKNSLQRSGNNSTMISHVSK